MKSKSQIKATTKYEDKAYFKTLVRFKKEDEERIRAAAGSSLNGFIVDSVLARVDELEKNSDSGVAAGQCPFL